jgi:hypothetical protein
MVHCAACGAPLRRETRLPEIPARAPGEGWPSRQLTRSLALGFVALLALGGAAFAGWLVGWLQAGSAVFHQQIQIWQLEARLAQYQAAQHTPSGAAWWGWWLGLAWRHLLP